MFGMLSDHQSPRRRAVEHSSRGSDHPLWLAALVLASRTRSSRRSLCLRARVVADCGMIAAIALLPLLGPWFGIRRISWAGDGLLLCCDHGGGHSWGVLRTLDRFDLISWHGTTYPIARAILVFIAWWQEARSPVRRDWFITDLAATFINGSCRGASCAAATCSRASGRR